MTWEVSKGIPIEIHCRRPEGPETKTALGAHRQYLPPVLGLMSIPLFLAQTLFFFKLVVALIEAVDYAINEKASETAHEKAPASRSQRKSSK